jgi:hypothetical protein
VPLRPSAFVLVACRFADAGRKRPAGYLSSSDKRVVVGLGSDRTARLIEIRRPAGGIQHFENVAAGRWIEVVEPAP